MSNVSEEVLEIARDLYDDADLNLNRLGEVEGIAVTEYEDYDGYYRDCKKADYDKAKKYLEDLVADVKYYDGNLVLSDNATLNDIPFDEIENQNYNEDEFWGVQEQYYDLALEQLENEIGTEVYGLGRSGRHICVDNTFDNLVNLETYKEAQAKWEQWFIDEIVKELSGKDDKPVEESLNSGEYCAKCLNCGKTVVYTKRDVNTDIDGTYIECPSCHATFDVDVDKKTEDVDTEDVDTEDKTYVSKYDELDDLLDTFICNDEARLDMYNTLSGKEETSVSDEVFEKWLDDMRTNHYRELRDYLDTLADEAEYYIDELDESKKVEEAPEDKPDEVEVKPDEVPDEKPEGETVTITDLHTDTFPIVNMYQYDIYNACDNLINMGTSSMSEDIDEIMLDFAKPLIEEQIKDVLPSASITFKDFTHPQYYRLFSNNNDRLLFDITYNVSEFEALKEKALADPEFEQYLQGHYKSYDGFASFFADNVKDFNDQEDWKQFVSVVSFYLPNNEEENNEAMLNKVYEELSSQNYETIDSAVENIVGDIYEEVKSGNMTLSEEDVTTYLKNMYGDIEEYDTLLDAVLTELALGENKKTELFDTNLSANISTGDISSTLDLGGLGGLLGLTEAKAMELKKTEATEKIALNPEIAEKLRQSLKLNYDNVDVDMLPAVYKKLDNLVLSIYDERSAENIDEKIKAILSKADVVIDNLPHTDTVNEAFNLATVVRTAFGNIIEEKLGSEALYEIQERGYYSGSEE